MASAAMPSHPQDVSPSSAAADPEPDHSEADIQYKGFGSFHSENVEDLIQLPPERYVPPPLPSFSTALSHTLDLRTNHFFGEIFRSQFLLDPKWVFVNHGAFGGVLRGAMDIKHKYEALMETQPLAFVDRTLLPLLVYSVRSLATFLGAAPTDLTLVPNATFGLNATIFGLIEPTDVVCYLDSEYGSVWRMLVEKAARCGATLKELPIFRHLGNHDVFGSAESITSYVEQHLPPGCTVFVLDHISSNGAFELPIFSHLIPMLRRKGVHHIIVDGAHGPLQCPLNFSLLKKSQRPSVYVGNLHKWISCPKSVGFIWCHESKVKAQIRTPIVSHGFGSGFLSEFIWNGTTDYGAHLTIPAVLSFWANVVGVEKVRAYCATLLGDAVSLMCDQLRVAALPLHAPFMALVRLPDSLQGGRFSAKYIQDALHYHHSIEVPVKLIEGTLYVRISAFVYNTLDDYEKLAAALLSIAAQRKRPRDGEEEKQSNSQPPSPQHTTNDRGCGIGGLGPSRNVVAFEEDSDEEELTPT